MKSKKSFGIAIGISIATFCTLLSLIHYNNAKVAPKKVFLYTRAIAIGEVVSKADLEQASVSEAGVPKEAIPSADVLVGKKAIRPVFVHEIATLKDAVSGASSSDAPYVANGFIGFSLPASWLAGPSPKVSRGDYVVVLASAPARQGSIATTPVLAPTMVARVETNREKGDSILLTLQSIDDAARLLQARANGLALEVVVIGSAAN